MRRASAPPRNRAPSQAHSSTRDLRAAVTARHVCIRELPSSHTHRPRRPICSVYTYMQSTGTCNREYAELLV